MKHFLKTLDIILYCLSLIIILLSGFQTFQNQFFIIQMSASYTSGILAIIWFIRILFFNITTANVGQKWLLFFTLMFISLLPKIPNSDWLPPPTSGLVKYSIYTQNVHQFGGDSANINFIVDQIKLVDPDIVFLLEFGLKSAWPAKQVVIEEFAQRCGYAYYNFSPQRDNIFGIAILSKYPIIANDLIFEYRGITNQARFLKFEHSGDTFTVVAAHFQSFNLAKSVKNIQAISNTLMLHKSEINEVFCQKYEPDIILGDFNESEFGPIIERTRNEKYVDIQRQSGKAYISTYVPLNIRLDFAFVKQNLAQDYDIEVLGSAGSDHRALLLNKY